jgi:hypothetical protein
MMPSLRMMEMSEGAELESGEEGMEDGDASSEEGEDGVDEQNNADMDMSLSISVGPGNDKACQVSF